MRVGVLCGVITGTAGLSSFLAPRDPFLRLPVTVLAAASGVATGLSATRCGLLVSIVVSGVEVAKTLVVAA